MMWPAKWPGKRGAGTGKNFPLKALFIRQRCAFGGVVHDPPSSELSDGAVWLYLIEAAGEGICAVPLNRLLTAFVQNCPCQKAWHNSRSASR
jgi:hypothetical protein